MRGHMRQLRTHDDIRAAIEGKAREYGALELPFVIVINIMDDFCNDYDVRNALFGEEQVVATEHPNGQVRHTWGTRVPNGAWRGQGGPRNNPCQRGVHYTPTVSIDAEITKSGARS